MMAICFAPFFLYPSSRVYPLEFSFRRSGIWRTSCIGASSAAPGVDLEALNAAIAKKDSDAVKDALDQLNGGGWARKWSSQPYVSRRTTSLRELTTLGIKNAENLAIPSVRNDAALLFTVVGTTGFLAVLASRLPGDWGFFVPYLIGSIPLIVLAVGSISPGLLQAAIGAFSSFSPDYQERIVRHEAAHFLGKSQLSSQKSSTSRGVPLIFGENCNQTGRFQAFGGIYHLSLSCNSFSALGLVRNKQEERLKFFHRSLRFNAQDPSSTVYFIKFSAVFFHSEQRPYLYISLPILLKFIRNHRFQS